MPPQSLFVSVQQKETTLQEQLKSEDFFPNVSTFDFAFGKNMQKLLGIGTRTNMSEGQLWLQLLQLAQGKGLCLKATFTYIWFKK